MKKRNIAIDICSSTVWMTCACVVLLFCSCGNSESDVLKFERIKVEREAALAAGNDAPSCKVLLEVDYAKGDNAETDKAVNEALQQHLFDMQGLTMQQAADSFATQYVRDYKGTLTALYEQDKNDTSKKAWYEYHYTIDTKTQGGRDGVVNYLINLDYQEGGAHGIKQLLVLNFDEQSGKLLTLSDVFVPGYETRLKELLLEKLMDLADAKTLDELKAKDYLYSMDMFSSENFVLNDDEITFIYNPYEIAPYEKGMTEISVTYSEVKEILVKN